MKTIKFQNIFSVLLVCSFFAQIAFAKSEIPKLNTIKDLDSWVGVYKVDGDDPKFPYALLYKDSVKVAQKQGQVYDRYTISFSEEPIYKTPQFNPRNPNHTGEKLKNGEALMRYGISLYISANGVFSAYSTGFDYELPSEEYFKTNAFGKNLNWPCTWSGTGDQIEKRCGNYPLQISSNGSKIRTLTGNFPEVDREIKVTGSKSLKIVIGYSHFNGRSYKWKHREFTLNRLENNSNQ